MALTQISTAGVKDDAVTAGKIPANAVGSSELADNAVDTAAIADQAVDLTKLPHGTGSNDGKFLRANNGADPTFETVTGTTINNNADNRVITGSGTANTLEGESTFTFDGSLVTTEKRMVIGNGTDFQIPSRSNTSSYTPQFQVTGAWNNPTHGATMALNGRTDYPLLWLNSGASFQDNSGCGVITWSIKDGAGNYCNTAEIRSHVDGTPGNNDSPGDLSFRTTPDGTCQPTERMRIDSSGRVGIQGTPNSSNFGAKLQVRESGQSATTLTAIFGANENSTGTTGGISDNTNKACRIGLPHYDTDQKAANMFVGYAGSGVNELYIGGGTGVMNGMTSVRIYADSSSSVNNGGNQVARFDSDGLKFGSDTAAANALDDYEEGSWTPSFNALSTGSVTVSHARYTKIGRMVFVQAYLTVNSTSGNNFEMSMPFAQVSYNIYAPLMTQVTMNNSDQVAVRINNGSTQAFVKDMADNDDKKTYNNLNGSLIMFAGSYEAQ